MAPKSELAKWIDYFTEEINSLKEAIVTVATNVEKLKVKNRDLEENIIQKDINIATLEKIVNEIINTQTKEIESIKENQSIISSLSAKWSDVVSKNSKEQKALVYIVNAEIDLKK